MNVDKTPKVITCVLPKGSAKIIIDTLFEKGISRFNFSNARGFGVMDYLATKTGLPKEEEKELLSVIAKDQQEADELFDLIYHAAHIGELHGGMMYMTNLSMASQFVLE
jgi:nitrogen regulatory protein PII